MSKYKIVRFFSNRGKVTIRTNVTLEQAQWHCNNPETSSTTCTKAVNRARTARYGAWFDGYEEMR